MNKAKKTRLHLAPAVFSLAATLAGGAMAAPDSYLCYNPPSGLESYQWNDITSWYDSTNGSANAVGRVPTSGDNVFLYSTRNRIDGSNPGKPILVGNGVNAETARFDIGDTVNGRSIIIGVTVKSGGTITNHGDVFIGNSGSRYNGGGYLTVESGGAWTAKGKFRLGISSGTSWLNVESGGQFSAENEFLVGHSYGAGIVTNFGEMVIKDCYVGGGGRGTFVNNGRLSVGNKFAIARETGSSGHFILEQGSTIEKTAGQPMVVAAGKNSSGVFECNADWTFADDDKLFIANNDGAQGRFIIGSGAIVTNLSHIYIGSQTNGCHGVLELRGGTLMIHGDSKSARRIHLGNNGYETTGTVRGWGAIRKLSGNLIMSLYGQVIADGGGMARDLILADVRTISTEDQKPFNNCETNGWFAVNKGKIVYPRAYHSNGEEALCVGDVYTSEVPSVLNSFRYALEENPGRHYAFAELYAADRDDIPSGLPASGRDVVAGVWRIGLSRSTGDAPTSLAFSGMSLTFRYDKNGMADDQMVAIYRHDGSPAGTWTRVCAPVPVKTAADTLTTWSLDSSSQTWNAGWFAIVAQKPKSTFVVFR